MAIAKGMDTLRVRVQQGGGVTVACGAPKSAWIEGGANGIQTFFMTADELQRFQEKQMKKFGRVNLRTGRVEKWHKDHWEIETRDDDDEETENNLKEFTGYENE